MSKVSNKHFECLIVGLSYASTTPVLIAWITSMQGNPLIVVCDTIYQPYARCVWL